MRSKALALLVLLLATALPLSGCYDSMDLSDQIFAVNMALDTGENKAMRLTMQYPQITPVGKEAAAADEGEELNKDGYLLEQVEGDTLADCLELMRMVTPRHIDLMHLRGLFLGESLTSERGLLWDSVTALLGVHGARPSAYVFVTRGRAEDVLKEQAPLFGARLSKSQSAQGRELLEQGVVSAVPLSAFRYDLADRNRNAVAMLCAVNNMQYISAPSPRGEQYTAYLAGDLPRNTVGKVDYCGSAVFGRETLTLLDGYETQLYNLLIGSQRAMQLTVDGRTARLTFPRAPRIRVSLDNPAAPRIEITLRVHSDAVDAAAYTEQLKRDVTALLLKLQQQNVDPVFFSKYARAQFLTVQQWEAYDWFAAYRRAAFVVGAA